MSDGNPPAINASAIDAALGNTHEHHDRSPDLSERLPVDRSLAALPVAGDHRERCAHSTVGHRNSGSSGRGNHRRHTGDDFEVEAGGHEGKRFFATPSEHERIAAFEANDVAPALAELNQQFVDQLLRDGGPRSLADVDQLGTLSCKRENSGANERIVHDDVGGLQPTQPADRQQVGVARPGADE